MTVRSPRPRAALLLALLLVFGGGWWAVAGGVARPVGSFAVRSAGSRAGGGAVGAPAGGQSLTGREEELVAGAESRLAFQPPATLGALAPQPAELFRVPLPSHQVVGFVPFGAYAVVTPTELADTSVLVFDGLQPAGSGALVRSGPGWTDLVSAGFPGFVSSAHAVGDKVLLDVSESAPGVIARLLADPGSSGTRLGDDLAGVVKAADLDGVDLDVEGHAGGEAAAFVTFVARLDAVLEVADPGATVLVNTYAASAGGGDRFFDVGALARHVNELFVMGYDLAGTGQAGPNAPLASPSPGLSDVQSLLDYLKVVPASKLVLGVPFYGYDFTTVSGTPGARTSTAAPESVTYADIVQVGRVQRWDPSSLTPYYVFRRAGRWHQTWFDDPASVALKAAVATELHLAGVGAWALTQEGGATAMLTALDGGAAPLRS